MITDLYTMKSFIAMGDSLKKCYDCDYCRANDNNEYHYHILPHSINPLFKRLPIAVNLFYGDPTLQWENTIEILKILEENNHEGIVMIVTKGKLKEIPKMNLKLQVGISFGLDIISQSNFEHNLEISKNSWYKFNIEYRPICNGINDSFETINYIFSMAKKYGTIPIAYSGLQLPTKELPAKYIPYDNHVFSGQKYIGKEIEKLIRELSLAYDIPIFSKTSCLISYMHGFDYDYNSHFLKPIGVGCKECINFEKCNGFRFKNIELPFEYEIEERENYTCSFVKNGLCKFPNKECLNMKGFFIKPKLKSITRGDARIIKWLSGCMADGVDELIETPFISDFWRI